MYFWVAALLPQQSEKNIRSVSLPLFKELGISNMVFLLNQHISLKIPFASDDIDAIYDYLNDVLSQYKPFYVETDKVEKFGKIVWVRFKDNQILSDIHSKLVGGLHDIFQITPHEFDTDFVFHSSIAIDKDQKKIDSFYSVVKDMFQNRKVLISAFIIGTSEDGADGTWKQTRKIQLDY
jgi:2'-5' RNA ligase